MTRGQLIVTADDVGLHRSMTDAAILAHREGIVTACSIVANGVEVDHAIDALRDVPSLDCGIHLTLVGEKPLASPEQIGSLVRGDRMHHGFAAFASRYFAGSIRFDEVERELRAQCELLLRSGLPLVHANGHQHLHVLPKVFEVVLRIAADYGIRYVRIPVDAGGKAGFSRRWSLKVLAHFARRAAGRARGVIAASDQTIGIAEAGHLNASRIVELLHHASGVTELVTHPGTNDRALEQVYRWGYAWEEETRALCDPAVRAAIAELGLELTAMSRL